MTASSSLSSSVWDRRSTGGSLSKNAFAGLVCFWTAIGIGVSAAAAAVSANWHLTGTQMVILVIVTLVSSIMGVIIALSSDNPVVSLTGYALVAIPFGLLLGPVVALYTAASVVKVLMITTGLVVILGVVGAIYPKSLESWGIYLFGALLVLILGSVVTMVAGALGVDVRGAMTVWDWIGVVIFSAYVIFDLNRAMRVDRTHDNAIDCALAVYLDFANLFIRLLSLLGDSKSDD